MSGVPMQIGSHNFGPYTRRMVKRQAIRVMRREGKRDLDMARARRRFRGWA